MDWTYFASKRFHVAEFQREASTTPAVVPMSNPATTAVRAKRRTENRAAKILSHASQAESMFAASRTAAIETAYRIKMRMKAAARCRRLLFSFASQHAR
jgi:hypothetical protein